MRYKTVKTANEASISGGTVEFEHHDKTLRGVRLTDAEGNVVLIQAGESYSNAVKVMVPEPFDQEERWKISGSVVGIPVTEYFDSEYEANDRVREIENASNGNGTVAKAKVKVLIDDAGAVGGEAA